MRRRKQILISPTVDALRRQRSQIAQKLRQLRRKKRKPTRIQHKETKLTHVRIALREELAKTHLQQIQPINKKLSNLQNQFDRHKNAFESAKSLRASNQHLAQAAQIFGEINAAYPRFVRHLANTTKHLEHKVVYLRTTPREQLPHQPSAQQVAREIEKLTKRSRLAASYHDKILTNWTKNRASRLDELTQMNKELLRRRSQQN